MTSYGIPKQQQVTTEMEAHLEEFALMGYTVLPGELATEECETLRVELDRVYAIQEKETGLEVLKEIKEENLARMPLIVSEAFVRLAARPSLMPMVESILGSFFVLHLQNGIINRPQLTHHQSSWHRDLPYQDWTSSAPLACNLYYCLDDFTSENGATCFLPFSHRIGSAPSEGFMVKHGVQVTAQAGSVILFDSMLFHRAGYNRSKDHVRRGVNHVYVRPILDQQIDLPSALGGRYADDPFLNMLLGYRTRLAGSVSEYRRGRQVNKNR